MFINYNSNPVDAKSYDSQRLRDEFLTEELFTADHINMIYSRIINLGGKAEVRCKGNRYQLEYLD